MKTTIIKYPRLAWTKLQELANHYSVRISAAGRNLILRADTAEDLVRMLSRIRTLQ